MNAKDRLKDAVGLLTSIGYLFGAEDLDNALHDQERKARELEEAYLAGDKVKARKLMIEIITLQGRLEYAVWVVQSMVHTRRSGIEDLPFE